MDDFEETNECRLCKDGLVCCVESFKFDKKFEYTLPEYKNGETQRIKVKECKVEPGDINWENLKVVGCEKCFRMTLFLTIVIAVSLISIAAMIWGNIKISEIPAPANCDSKIDSAFANMTPAFSDEV